MSVTSRSSSHIKHYDPDISSVSYVYLRYALAGGLCVHIYLLNNTNKSGRLTN